MNLHRSFIALVAAILMIGAQGTVSAATIVDINALSDTGITLNLSPGTYVAIPIGIAGGGVYDAWNGLPGTTNGCDADGKNCQDGWTTRFEVSSASLGVLDFNPPDGNFLTAAIALENAISGVFTLTVAEAVRFRVLDNPADYGDNVGGVSLSVSQVPLPAALPLFLAALGGLGLFGWRRRRATA